MSTMLVTGSLLRMVATHGMHLDHFHNICVTVLTILEIPVQGQVHHIDNISLLKEFASTMN